MLRVGTAGWAIPKDDRAFFPETGSRLEQYSRVFSCVEIDSSFYRSHRATTYERWAASVPDGFRFSLKVPKTMTHERRLIDCEALIAAFLNETSALAQKRDVLLVQLPPSFAFEHESVARYFAALREGYSGRVACEPRHRSWFETPAETLLRGLAVARVAADPPVVPQAALPGAYDEFAYYRWHGAPRTYYSAYDDARIAAFAASLDCRVSETWCVFDNTALGAATRNALQLTGHFPAC